MRIRILTLLMLLSWFLPAQAVTVLVSLTDPPTQVQNTASVTAGMKVTGKTIFWALSVAGGFTISCEYTTQTIPASTSKYTGSIAPRLEPLELSIYVPYTGKGTYTTAGFGSWGTGCKTCNFVFTASATDGQFTAAGAGATISFPVSADTKADTKTFSMCSTAPVCPTDP